MQQQHSIKYVLLFSIAVCGVCAVLVSTAAVTLSERQEVNALLSKQKNVLEAAGLTEAGEKLGQVEITERFKTIEPIVIALETGEKQTEIDPLTFDQQAAKKDPARSHAVESNPSRISRVPNNALVYEVYETTAKQKLKMIVLPIEGYGLWGTLYGFLALDKDTNTVRGITYYQHKETPGLGGEVDNPSWKALWPGRRAFEQDGGKWVPAIEVVKGRAGKPDEAPHKVDGLSGATITSRGVTNMLHFWLGPEGFGPYLEKVRQQQGQQGGEA